MHHRDGAARRGAQVRHLVVEEDVRLEHAQHARLVHPAQEKGLVGRDAPAFQCGNDALVRGRIARRDDGDAHDAPVSRIGARGVVLEALQHRQLAKQRCQRPHAVRARHVQGFVGVEFVEVVVALEDGLGFVVGQHAVEVEGHAQFQVAVFVGDLRGQHQSGRVVDGDRILDVVLVRAQEQRGVKGRQVGVGRLAVHEGGA